MSQNDDFADLIKRQAKLDWNELKAKIPGMQTSELIDLMVKLSLYVNRTLAREIAKRSDAVFHLRKLIQDGQHWYQKGPGNAWSPIHAIHILALVRSKEALELLLDTLRYRGEDLSDSLTEDVPRLLVAFGEDAIGRFMEFTEDETLESFVRDTAVTALAVSAKKYPSRGDEVKKHMIKLLNTSSDPTFTALVIDELASLHDPSVLPDLHRTFEEGKVDESLVTKEEVDSIINGAYAEQDEDHFRRHSQDPLNHFSRENIEYLHNLHYTKSERMPTEQFERIPTEPKPEKVGRNDPCPCGSGKKYKKCCWLKIIGMKT